MNLLTQALNKQTEIWKHEVIDSKSKLNDWLMYESTKYAARTKVGGVIPLSEQDFILKYQKRLRLTEYYLNTNKKIRYLLSRTLLVRFGSKYGPNIRLNSCGRGLYLAHLGNVITNGDIGCDCKIAQNVTIGHNHGKTPVIGNNVSIYTGSTIIGGIYLADSIVVGANSLVNKDFENRGCTIAGVPAKVLGASVD